MPKAIHHRAARAVFYCLALFFFCAPAHAKRVALVIGNDNYTSVAKLKKAGNDATAIAKELGAAGFAVQLHRDLNYRSMVKVVEVFTNSITGGDEVVVFFAGHGVQIRSGGYLLPTDIEASSESEVEKTAYELNALTDKLSEARASFSLVIVDACRDNPLKSHGRSIGNTRGLTAIEPAKGQMVVYSASRGQQALDSLDDTDRNPNGVFTREFIARMRRPGVRIEDLMREVQDAVESLARTVGYEQRPAIYNEARGNFYFFGPTTVQVAPKPAAAPEMTAAQREDTFWADAKLAGNKEAFAAYLNGYPEGRYAGLAKANIARLSPVTPPPAPAPVIAPPAPVAVAAAPGPVAAAPAPAPMVAPATPAPAIAPPASPVVATIAAPAAPANAPTAGGASAADPGAVVAIKAPTKNATTPNLASLDLAASKAFRDCPDCPDMVAIPAGSFEMGSLSTEAGRLDSENSVHTVNVTAFALARTEVTRAQFEVFVKESGYKASTNCVTFEEGKAELRRGRGWQNPGFPQEGNHPAICLTWEDAKAYVDWLSRKTGKRYRLPSEAEWEYAARAGTKTARYWGAGSEQACENANIMDDGSRAKVPSVAWESHPCSDGYGYTSPVGSFRPNAFGLYDMIGNAREWVEDCWNSNYNGAPADGSAWTSGNCSRHALRGGSWDSEPRAARAAARNYDSSGSRQFYAAYIPVTVVADPLRINTTNRFDSNGFRPARALP